MHYHFSPKRITSRNTNNSNGKIKLLICFLITLSFTAKSVADISEKNVNTTAINTPPMISQLIATKINTSPTKYRNTYSVKESENKDGLITYTVHSISNPAEAQSVSVTVTDSQYTFTADTGENFTLTPASVTVSTDNVTTITVWSDKTSRYETISTRIMPAKSTGTANSSIFNSTKEDSNTTGGSNETLHIIVIVITVTIIGAVLVMLHIKDKYDDRRKLAKQSQRDIELNPNAQPGADRVTPYLDGGEPSQEHAMLLPTYVTSESKTDTREPTGVGDILEGNTCMSIDPKEQISRGKDKSTDYTVDVHSCETQAPLQAQ